MSAAGNVARQISLRESEIFSGGGETGALMRSLDWSKTVLGTPDAWPSSLKTAVSICLNSRFPIVIFWGREFAVLYNDAYIPMLGPKHPRARPPKNAGTRSGTSSGLCSMAYSTPVKPRGRRICSSSSTATCHAKNATSRSPIAPFEPIPETWTVFSAP
jgi:hypothetical protein